MKSTTIFKHQQQRSLQILSISLILGTIALFTPDWHVKLLAAPALNATQNNMLSTINSNCSDSVPTNAQDFQDRCSSLPPPGTSANDTAIRQISPEQTISYGTNATKTSTGQSNSANQTVMNRMSLLRSGTPTIQAGGVQLYNNGQPLNQNNIASLAGTNRGTASADQLSNLGVWVNGIFRFGDVDSTFQEQKGYNFHNLGVTIGVDYGLTEDLILGGAFTYLSTSGEYDDNAGSQETDLFNGSIYGSYYITDDFYIDGLAFYGGNNYNITRNINYTAVTGLVNSQVEGTPGGSQYGFNFATGYNYSHERLIVGPYASVAYLSSDVDAYSENELGPVTGWATSFGAQGIRSLKTTVGTLISYNFDVPWGVVIPQVRGEWHHEFKDDARTITSHFNGAGGADDFNVIVDGPDRDYFTFGTSVTSTFDYGITAFLAYDMLIGYNTVNSYGFTLGGRIDF